MAAGTVDEDFYLYGDQGKLSSFSVPQQLSHVASWSNVQYSKAQTTKDE